MGNKLSNVTVLFVHDQGDAGEIKISGTSDATGITEEHVINISTTQSTQDRLLQTLILAKLNNSTLASVTLENEARGNSVKCVAC